MAASWSSIVRNSPHHRALQSLPADQRATFLLVAVEGQSYREAAEALGIPVGTVMSRLARARSRIAILLAQGEGGEDDR
jgi:RNA polymerase sigma-70 factor (ECF subfamily)